MDYGNILSRSWRVVWEHKFMILIGFLAALGSGLGNGGNNFQFSGDSSDFPMLDAPFMRGDFSEIMAVVGAVAAGALCFALILGIVLWFLRLTAEAGLIDAASRLDGGQKVSFGEAMSAGWSYIWRMLGLNILLFGGVALLFLVVFLILGFAIGGSFAGAASSSSDVSGVLAAMGAGLVAVLCCAICGLILLAIVVNIVHTFAQRAIVLENRSVIDAISRGWQVIRANLGDVIVLLLIFMVIGFLVGALIWAVLLPFGALSFGPAAARLFSGEALSTLDIILMVVGGLAMIVIVAAIRSFYVAFRSSAFTLTFQELTDKKLPAAE